MRISAYLSVTTRCCNPSYNKYEVPSSCEPNSASTYSRHLACQCTMGETVRSPKARVNLLRGWPAPQSLPAGQLREAALDLLSNPTEYVPALQYGPDPGSQALREELSRWLARMYSVSPDPERICITGGASQNLARILQRFTDPRFTRMVWMVAPCYYLACPIFEDAGFSGRLRAVPEDPEGIDIAYLARGLALSDSDLSADAPVSLRSSTLWVKPGVAMSRQYHGKDTLGAPLSRLGPIKLTFHLRNTRAGTRLEFIGTSFMWSPRAPTRRASP